ncbi:hypothetical protein LCP9604111_1074 [Penicillium roqueforti]|uniref:uncharacterized protein n=1 Tax=Penicillium roqueforti TaxID=5082 RepID=UPI00190B6CCE|nr:uncharacterized protein LCP9604111_1074 [Penicillium roqueforti]KAF9253548.1 hypothetical protein LCP9604111_1074 [Penicillium roqueforti]KAI3142869.1 hypothetical protein CBS147330_656 [Penicillium roqueforti]
MAEDPQLNSIQQRIAALNQSQLARPPGGPGPSFRPTERSASVNNPPSYDAVGSVVDRTSVGNEPADNRTQRPVLRPPPMETLRPQVKPKPKAPPPLPTRRSDRLPPPTPARPPLPPRRPTDQKRRPSLESATSDASHSTTSTATTTTTGRGTSTTSVNSTGNNRIKAPAWGETELPALPARRPKEQVSLEPAPRPTISSKRSFGSLSARLTSKISLPGSKPPVPSIPSQPAQPTQPPRPTSSPNPNQSPPRYEDEQPPVPRLPSRRPSAVPTDTNGTGDDSSVNLPIRKTLPPPPMPAQRKDPRQLGFGNPKSSTAAPNGTPPPVPHGSRPDLSKIMASKPRLNGSAVSPSPPPPTSDTECMVCRDFSGPDNHAARYPRASLPTQDMTWLANELTAPFPSLTDKARAIFTWLHHNIAYDTYAFFNNCVKSSTPASTLASGLAVCEGYAGLFAALATHAGLEAIVVGGHGKGFGHNALAPGAPVPPFEGNHAWNAVKIDGGRWKLIDSCWGAGAIDGAGQPYKQRFEPSMFTMPNEEFGLKHFPSNKRQFFREDGRPDITWEEYILTDPERPNGVQALQVYSDADKRTIGRKTFHPQGLHISISTPGAMRFQFGLLCPHWTLARHSHIQHAGLFLLMIHGVDGREDDKLPFTHVPGSGPAGGGEFWYVDVPSARMLGAPGQKLQLAVLTSFGDRKDASGVTAQEFQEKVGRVGMGWAYVAEWELVR